MLYPLRGWNGYGYLFWQWTFYGTHHKGLDLICPKGTPVYASIGGRAYPRTGIQGGKQIWQYSDDRKTRVRYMHLSKMLVLGGENIEAGCLIGYTGNTGLFTTGPHLHVDIQINGKWRDPEKLFEKLINNDNNNDMDYNEAKGKLLKDNEFLLDMFNTLQSNGFIKRDQRIATDANNILRRGRGSKWLIDKARRYLLGKKLSDYEFILDKFSRPLRSEEADYKEVKDKKEVL